MGRRKVSNSDFSELYASIQIREDKRELTRDIDLFAERKPVDPPPIVQIRVREEGTYLAQ